MGEVPSRRRGQGSEIIGHRPYEPGDPVARVDWFASARLAMATGQDAFIVREHAADEAPRVALVVDRRPQMALYPPALPWLHKDAALREAVDAIAASAAAARADVGALDFGDGDGEAWWLPPGRRERRSLIAEREGADAPFAAPPDTLERSLEFLTMRRRELPSASFVFVLSDYLEPPPPAAWMSAVACGWDLVAVVIQDPVWEQSFPEVGGIGVPVTEPGTGTVAPVRLSRRQAARRREANERRLAATLADLEALGLSTVVIGTADPDRVDAAFVAWAQQRTGGRWTR